jgi:glucose-1-phosphate thymidylyltransferase
MGDIVGLLGSGREIDVNFTYRVQDQAGGIAQALLLTQNFVAEDCCMVILGDNVFTSPINVLTDKFRKHGAGACIAMKEVKDPERYGVAQTDSKGIVISIEEKPNKPKSNMAVTGAYVYSPVVFDIIKTLKPSGRGELEITDVNNAYIKKNELIGVQLDKKCDWTDAGTFESLLHANKLANKLEVPKVVEKIMKRL